MHKHAETKHTTFCFKTTSIFTTVLGAQIIPPCLAAQLLTAAD